MKANVVQEFGTLSTGDFGVGLRERDGTIVLDLKGRLVCGPSQRCFDNLIGMLADQGKSVIFNFNDLVYIDSRGIGSLVESALKLRDQVVMINLGSRLDSLLAICKLTTVLPLCNSEDDAIRVLRVAVDA
jgi:anti-anti-sigma factor